MYLLWKSYSAKKIVHIFIQSFGAGLYFYADNINEVLETYHKELGCNEQCLRNNRIAATVTLGLALTALQFIPHLLHDIMGWEENKQSTWYLALDMIITITKIEVLYTAVAIMTQTNEYCGHIDRNLSISFIVICSFLGVFIMISKCFHVRREEIDKKITLSLACVFSVVGFLPYLLADNSQPLDCAFGCDFRAINQTRDEQIRCNEKGVSILKLVLMIISFIIILPVGLSLIRMDRVAELLATTEEPGKELQTLAGTKQVAEILKKTEKVAQILTQERISI